MANYFGLNLKKFSKLLVTKSFRLKIGPVNEVANAVRAVHMGERYIAPDIAQKLALSRFPIGQETPFDSLSERELQVVLMIALEAKKVTQIARELNLNSKTVNTYRYRIFEKLGVDNDVGIV
ncbi:MAG: hypothetical protein GY782_08960 [Gammaproteobacteria bacterium]|nr:hypothetical protein [Gammaproteobacteria bacterium]